MNKLKLTEDLIKLLVNCSTFMQSELCDEEYTMFTERSYERYIEEIDEILPKIYKLAEEEF